MSKQQQQQPSDFASSPLITPERLDASLVEALGAAPAWAIWYALADDEASPSESMAVVRLGDKHPNQYPLPAVSLAILFEITRYGNSATTNTNSQEDDEDARYYPKVTYRGATKDDTTVGRLIMAALPRQRIIPAKDGMRTLHPASLGREPDRKATKDARAIAMHHCERVAREHRASDGEVQAYLDNLRALFAYHDVQLAVVA